MAAPKPKFPFLFQSEANVQNRHRADCPFPKAVAKEFYMEAKKIYCAIHLSSKSEEKEFELKHWTHGGFTLCEDHPGSGKEGKTLFTKVSNDPIAYWVWAEFYGSMSP